MPPLAVSLVALLCGCGDDSSADDGHGGGDAGSTPDGAVGTDEFGVRVAGDGTLDLVRGDDVLLRLPPSAFQLGRVDAIDDAANYDPYPRLAGLAGWSDPPGFQWLVAERADVVAEDAGSIELSLAYPGGKTAAVRVTTKAEGRFAGELVPAESGDAIAMLRIAARADASEGFYGLGEYYDSVNHRGKLRAMQLELGGGLESNYNEAHVPIPFVIGTRGWGLFVESPYPAAFEVASAQDDLVQASFGTGAASTDGLAFHLFAAAHPLDVTRHYHAVTGPPRLPARWALGPWIWRDENDDQAQVERDLDAIRDLDLATTAVWIDRPYATGVNTFDFDAAKFPDADAMIEKAHALGLRMALWHTPYLDEDDPSTQPLRDEADAEGYYPPKSGLRLNGWGTALDFTNPAAFAWWQDLIRRYTDRGIEGFKLDYAEDVVPGAFGVRNQWLFSDGSDERTMHALYQLLYHRVYAETLPSEGGLLLCRHATYGDQKNVSVVWPGDLDASFARQGDVVADPGGSFVSVGGLPASLIAGLSLGPSGFPFYGADTGGYRHSPPDKETFVRWFEQTALSSVMQVGTSSNDVAWEFRPENGFDQESLDWYRQYTRLHLRLWPYEWTYATRLVQDGRPIQRALGLAYPELGEHPDDVYLFGDELLVAPVVERGVVEREVPFPPGRWLDWWSGAVHEGPARDTVAAPLGVLPLFVREGGIVPMLRPTIDAMAPTTEPARVDSYATTPGVLWARMAPAGPEQADPSRFVLFDGAEVSQQRTPGGLSLGSKDGQEFAQGVVFELIGMGAAPQSVKEGETALPELGDLAALEAGASGWAFDPAVAGGTLRVKVQPGTRSVTVAI